MDIIIIYMDRGDWANLKDLDSGKEYFMNDDTIEEHAPIHDDISTRGPAHPFDLSLYRGKHFESLEDARKYISKCGLQWRIEHAIRSPLSDEKKQAQVLKLYRQALEELEEE